jgi:N-acetyl sugar amidotransferase
VFKGAEGERRLREISEKIRLTGKGKPYDCILGLSGGADSTYLALLATQMGLRPLLVHFDYGWNSEIAVNNIEQAVKALKLDLYTYVMDWPEFKDILRAYFKASVLDLDVPADHMIFGALYQMANKYGIKYLLSGNNVQTEFTLPPSWNYNKFDIINLRDIHSKFGTVKLRHFPSLGLWHHAYYSLIKNINSVQLLNNLDYNKEKVRKTISEQLGWRDYGGKHHESVFTRFYQGYILPVKFNIDKRKAHLSNLIFSGQMSRDAALTELSKPTYDVKLQHEDMEYVAKKLGFSNNEFEEVLSLANKSHSDYRTDHAQRELYFNLMKSIRPVTRLIKKIR